MGKLFRVRSQVLIARKHKMKLLQQGCPVNLDNQPEPDILADTIKTGMANENHIVL